MKHSKKIVVLGHFGVGKSSLVRQFVENVFTEDYKVTIGVHVLKKDIKIDKKNDVTLVLWDLEGIDNIENIRTSYLLGTHAFIYVFDLTRPSTYQNLENEINYISKNHAKTPCKIVANKRDLVTKKALEAEALFSKHEMIYTSAKTGENVNELFTDLAKTLIK